MKTVAARNRRNRWSMLAAGAAALALVVSGCGSSTPASTTRGPAGTYTAPASIASNCSRNVTADLLRWIGSVGDGSVLRFAPGGCYRIDGTLRIEDRNNLTFEGNGATFKPLTDGTELGPRLAMGRAQFVFIRGSNITVQNLNVRGARDLGLNAVGYDLEAQHAFAVGQTVGFHLRNVHASHVYGDFVYVGGGTRNVLVEGSTFDSSGRQGWTVQGGANIRFTGNYIANVSHATVDLEPSNYNWLDGLSIDHNVVGKGRLYFFNIGGSPNVTFKNISILNNQLVEKALRIQVNPQGTVTNFTVIGNTSTGSDANISIDQNGGGAMFFNYTTNVTVRDNRLVTTWGRHTTGLHLAQTDNVVVTGNTFTGADASISYYGTWHSSHVCWSGNYVHKPVVLEPPSNPSC